MKGFLLFIFLSALVVCQHPESHEGKHEERVQRRKQMQKDINDCILKGEISTELRSKLEENKEDLRHTLHLFMNKLDTKDKEVIRKCRREVFGKMKELFHGRKFNNFLNRTKYRHHPLLHERYGNHTLFPNVEKKFGSAHPSHSAHPSQSAHPSHSAHASATTSAKASKSAN